VLIFAAPLNSATVWTPVPEDVVELPLSSLVRGFYQPREYFTPEAMEATRRSIQEKGQLYPVVVRPIRAGNPLFDPAWEDPHYELADGERRFRCCKELGHPLIKAIVRDLSDEQMLDYTLTTNDSMPLNPIERAQVYFRLANEFGRTQEEIAKSFNLKQQQVSEYMRLLELPEQVRDLTARAVLSVRHARELLKISDSETIKRLAKDAVDGNLGTRELTELVKKANKSFEKSKFHEKVVSNIDFSSNIDLRDEERLLITKKIEINYDNYPVSAILWPFSVVNRLIFTSSFRNRLSEWSSYQLGWLCQGEDLLALIEVSVLLPVLLSFGLFFTDSRLPALAFAMLASIFFFIVIPLRGKK
jgi:ParB family chromosome partitioning protein